MGDLFLQSCSLEAEVVEFYRIYRIRLAKASPGSKSHLNLFELQILWGRLIEIARTWSPFDFLPRYSAEFSGLVDSLSVSQSVSRSRPSAWVIQYFVKVFGLIRPAI